MVSRVLHRLLFVAALCLPAGPAFAQDGAPDPFGDAVREQHEVRARAFQKAMSAPTAAIEHWRETDMTVGYGNEKKRPKGASEFLPPPGARDDGIDWNLVIAGGVAAFALLFFVGTRRMAGRPSKSGPSPVLRRFETEE